jgi:dihydroorotate dehydrogenase
MFNFTKPFYPLYLNLVKRNPEQAHLQLLNTLEYINQSRQTPWGNFLCHQLEKTFCFNDPQLTQSLWGLTFTNPLGLAPGFDKNGVAAGIWSSFGFGFAELGAVTLHAQTGNPRPRLFRLPLDQAALNRMGANNLGAKAIAQTLEEIWTKQPPSIPIGINLCKSKITPLEEAHQDYLGSFQLLREVTDYFVINVSSPNTPGLRSLQGSEELDLILATLQQENQGIKPLFIKIAPDLDFSEIKTILTLVQNHQLSGIIATNTTIKREGLKTQILPETGKPITEEAGGISGLPLKERSTEIIRFIYQETGGKIPIIGVGGIFTPEDAWEKITSGASLLQFYTGMIYEGPWIVKNIQQGLLQKLAQHGLTNISEAVGIFFN